MVYVTKTEFETLKAKFPNLRSTTTSKDKGAKRKKRFVEEYPEVLKAIEDLRKQFFNNNSRDSLHPTVYIQRNNSVAEGNPHKVEVMGANPISAIIFYHYGYTPFCTVVIRDS